MAIKALMVVLFLGFHSVMMGMAIAPAILGLAQNSVPDLEAGLKLVFLVGAVTVAVSLLMIVTIDQFPGSTLFEKLFDKPVK